MSLVLAYTLVSLGLDSTQMVQAIWKHHKMTNMIIMNNSYYNNISKKSIKRSWIPLQRNHVFYLQAYVQKSKISIQLSLSGNIMSSFYKNWHLSCKIIFWPLFDGHFLGQILTFWTRPFNEKGALSFIELAFMDYLIWPKMRNHVFIKKGLNIRQAQIGSKSISNLEV